MNAFSEAVKSENREAIEETLPSLVHSFIIGNNAKLGDIQSLDGTLYDKSTVLARRSKNGVVLLPTNSMANTALNDSLIGSLYANKIPFRRLTTFGTLLNSAQRVQELRDGKYEDFAAVAGLFGFTFTPQDIEAIERSKAFTKKATEFFSKLEKEEQHRIKSAAEKERLALVAKQAIAWDSGEGSMTNSNVRGAGDSPRRIRLSKDKKQVQLSSGYEMTVTQAKVAWALASSYWHGGGTSRAKALSKSYNARRAQVDRSSLHIGCQVVTRAEVERFADSVGWERKEPKK